MKGKPEKEKLNRIELNNVINTNYFNAKIDNIYKNSKNRLCSDRDETDNHISECSKLAQKEYKIRFDWVGKVIHYELCKRLNIDHIDKFYPHKRESVLENEMHKILWDFEILLDHLILVRRPDLILINKKKRTCHLINFVIPADHRMKIKGCEKLDLARDLKNCVT